MPVLKPFLFIQQDLFPRGISDYDIKASGHANLRKFEWPVKE